MSGPYTAGPGGPGPYQRVADLVEVELQAAKERAARTIYEFDHRRASTVLQSIIIKYG